MVEAFGTVVELDGANAWVETERQSSCSSCSSKGGCGTGALSRVVGNRSHRIRVNNEIRAVVGDTVTIGVPEDGLVVGSVAVYIAPLIALMGGAFVGQVLAPQWGFVNPEPATIVGGLIGLLGGFAWLRRFGRQAAKNDRYRAVVLRIEHRRGEAVIGIDRLTSAVKGKNQE